MLSLQPEKNSTSLLSSVNQSISIISTGFLGFHRSEQPRGNPRARTALMRLHSHCSSVSTLSDPSLTFSPHNLPDTPIFPVISFKTILNTNWTDHCHIPRFTHILSHKHGNVPAGGNIHKSPKTSTHRDLIRGCRWKNSWPKR